MANLFACLAILSFAVLSNAQIQFFRGGYFTYRQLANQKRMIYFDYALFFDLDSEEARRCTQDAIERKTRFTSDTIRYAMWTDLIGAPELLGKIGYYCAYKDPLVMKKVVVRFENIRHDMRTRSADKFYFGIEAPEKKYRTYVYVDLTPRKDTMRMNTSPTVNMFPHYLVREGEEKRITIQAFDVDEDYIKCFSVSQFGKRPLSNCELVIPDSQRNGLSVQQVLVADYRNKDSNVPFSSIKVVFEVSKLARADNPNNKPSFTLGQPFTCIDHDDVDGTTAITRRFEVSNSFQASTNPLYVFGPPGISYKVTPGRDKRIIDFSWVPKENQKGKHIVCFYTSVTELFTRITHVADPKCLYFSVGKEHTHVQLDLLKPTKEVTQEEFDHYKIKVYGAFEKPTQQSYFALQNANTKTLQYYFELSREPRYIITNENDIELRSSEIRPVAKGEDYQIRLTAGLFKAQARCAKVPSISLDDDTDYKWIFRVLSDEEARNANRRTTTTPATTTKQSTTRQQPDIFRPTGELKTIRPSGENKYKTILTCRHDGFQVRIAPTDDKPIKKITLFDEKCEVRKISDIYSHSLKYNECDTEMMEEANHIIFKNVAIVHFGDEIDPNNNEISRSKTYKIGLECRLPRSAVHSVKGKRVENAPSSMQQVQFDSVESSEGAFGIDFEVYKSNRYIEAYSPNEFPIRVAKDSRMYFQLSLDRDNLNLIPQNCYATRTEDHRSSDRYYIIEKRCEKDNTYKQHRQTYNEFQFSIQSFVYKNSSTMFVHCESLVCHDTTTSKCQYGCDKKRFARSITDKNGKPFFNKTAEYDETETFVTSTLEIKITEGKRAEEKMDLTKILLFAQIPIAILLVAIIFFAWRCISQRNAGKKSKQMYYEEDQQLKPGEVAM